MTTNGTNGGHGAAAPAPKAPEKSFEELVTRGRVDAPIRMMLYGVGGVGKTSFAASAPDPIFLPTERGSEELDVARMPVAGTWLEFNRYLDRVRDGKHAHKTLVIDTVSWLEPLLWDYLCERDNHKMKGELKVNGRPYFEGYGWKGPNVALDEWSALLVKLDKLSLARNMHIVLLAHDSVQKERNPAGADYGIIAPRLHKTAADKLYQWCGVVLYAEHRKVTVEDALQDRKGRLGRAKMIADESGARVVHTENRGAFKAKNRYGMPAQIELSWAKFYDYATRAPSQELLEQQRMTEDLRDLVAKLVDEEYKAKIDAWLEQPRPREALAKAINGATVRLEKQTVAAAAADDHVAPSGDTNGQTEG